MGCTPFGSTGSGPRGLRRHPHGAWRFPAANAHVDLVKQYIRLALDHRVSIAGFNDGYASTAHFETHHAPFIRGTAPTRGGYGSSRGARACCGERPVPTLYAGRDYQPLL